ncbi:Asp23/Gls24 family envelope stress response protein [Defluviitalea phaphyphila]|uniref:Asp23/Gls24 family envelope stress response protein n=1 Tax=Defluviitalea phaphyphila TaxID=1473580 RepID=UPI0007313A0C|nr:Asp23/Gls24 family envelope stress response protein [Defluviitalea phaphyphila]
MDERNAYTMDNINQIGQIQIADEVIAIIAGLSATEVEGVAGMSGNFAGGIAEILGKKNLTKGVKVEVGESEVSIDLSLVIKFGFKIPEVAAAVQSKVKNAVKTMTGLSVIEINLHITGVYFDKNKSNNVNGENEVLNHN